MPQLEAAYCGVPVMSIDYSAMESVLKNIGGISLKPLEYSMECETGCYRAIPDNEKFINELEYYIKNPHLRSLGLKMCNKARSCYNWDKTANIWIEYLKTVPVKDISKTWNSPPQIKIPAESISTDIKDLKDQVTYIFRNVLHKPEWIGGYLWCKMIKDCTFGYRVHNSEEDYYFNESHLPKQEKYKKFNFADAVKELTNLRNQWNQWEKLRGEKNDRL
jgi:hypothetical protein